MGRGTLENRSDDSARSDTAAGMSETRRWRLPEISSSLAASVLQTEISWCYKKH